MLEGIQCFSQQQQKTEVKARKRRLVLGSETTRDDWAL